jgi:uncharacterized protein (DUF1330 family)
MKSRYKVGAAVIGSFVLGVGAASVLHAQARPPAYVWAEIDVKDWVSYNKYFLAQAQANIRESGGKFLAGNSNAAGPTAVSLNGYPPPDRVVLLQFADMEAVKAFYAKQHALEADVGSKYASFRVVAIEGN